jgi:signal transduction histidine kinase
MGLSALVFFAVAGLVGPTRAGLHHSVLLAVGLATLVLWGFSGRIAWQLTRPFAELARVAQDLGAGRLQSRVRLGRHQGFEARVLSHALNDMAERIEKQLRDQRELLAAVSHEMRTPLARMRVLVELARGQGAALKTLDELDREVMELDELVGELLASARLDFTALTFTRVRAADAAARALERAGLSVELLKNEAGDADVEVDPTLIARALANLLDNAKRHGGGARALAVVPREGRVELSVEDGGPGFPPGEETKAFAPFQRGAPRRQGSERPGLGLGLSLVRRIAEAHGGRAFANNLPTGGARVGFDVAKAG